MFTCPTVRFDEVATLIHTISEQKKDFPLRTEQLIEVVEGCTEDEFLEHLDYAGVIPESFAHDSTEEKLFAKYCDWRLAESLRMLGMKAAVLTQRADAADVEAVVSGDYSMVGDAKAFRLSRTANNQKDFKVVSLNLWRR